MPFLKKKEDSAGEVCLALRYVPKTQKLTVLVVECRNLLKMDILGSSDPYVKIALMHGRKRVEKRKTTTKVNTLNPYYKESFDFDVSPERVKHSYIIVTVMDYDRFSRNDLIGTVTIGPHLTNSAKLHWTDMFVTPGHSIAQWHHLENEGFKAAVKNQKLGEMTRRHRWLAQISECALSR